MHASVVYLPGKVHSAVVLLLTLHSTELASAVWFPHLPVLLHRVPWNILLQHQHLLADLPQHLRMQAGSRKVSQLCLKGLAAQV